MKKLLKKKHVKVAAIIKKRYELARNNPAGMPELEWVMQDLANYFQDKDNKEFNYDEFMRQCGHPRFQPRKEVTK